MILLITQYHSHNTIHAHTLHIWTPIYSIMYTGNEYHFIFVAGTPPGPNKMVKVPTGVAVVGKPRDFPSYGWDNEYGQYQKE